MVIWNLKFCCGDSRWPLSNPSINITMECKTDAQYKLHFVPVFLKDIQYRQLVQLYRKGTYWKWQVLLGQACYAPGSGPGSSFLHIGPSLDSELGPLYAQTLFWVHILFYLSDWSYIKEALQYNFKCTVLFRKQFKIVQNRRIKFMSWGHIE
jgi:hypothetical protein